MPLMVKAFAIYKSKLEFSRGWAPHHSPHAFGHVWTNAGVLKGMSASPCTTSLWPFMNQSWSAQGDERRTIHHQPVVIYEPKLEFSRWWAPHHSPPACGHLWTKTGVVKDACATIHHQPVAVSEAKLEFSRGWAPLHSPIGRLPFMKQDWSPQGDERLFIHPSAACHLWSKTGALKGVSASPFTHRPLAI